MIRRSAELLRNWKNLTIAAAAATLLAGCQVPGGSFASEPMQLRFAAMTRSALAADEARPCDPYAAPVRLTAAEPIVIAGKAGLTAAN